MTNRLDTAPHRTHNKDMESQRIVTAAAKMVAAGVPPMTAIEVACRTAGATPRGREMARKVFVAAAARVERGEG